MSQDEMSSTELAKVFGEANPVAPTTPSPPNANSIYEVNARILNLARAGGLSITPTGTMLCNTYTHVMLAFYAFAETLPEADKERLTALIRKQESMPATLISAAFAGVKS